MSEKQVVTSRDSSVSEKPNTSVVIDSSITTNVSVVAHPVSTTKKHLHETFDLNFSGFLDDMVGNIEEIKKNGGSYLRVWLLRHFPINDVANFEKKLYSDLSKKLRSDLTPEEDKWVKYMDSLLWADVDDKKHQEVVKAIVRNGGEDEKIPVYTDTKDTIKPRNSDTAEWVERLGNNRLEPVNLETSKWVNIGESLFSSVDQLKDNCG